MFKLSNRGDRSWGVGEHYSLSVNKIRDPDDDSCSRLRASVYG